MKAKLSYHNFFTSLIQDVSLGVVSASGAWLLLNHPDWWPIGGPMTLVPAVKFLNRHPPRRLRPTYASIIESIAPRAYVNLPPVSADPDIRSRQIRYNGHVLADEFVYVHRMLPAPVGEDTLHRFIKLARRRQNKAIYGTGLHSNEYGKMRINWVLSENYFTRRTRPRFILDQFHGCLIILAFTRLIQGRGPGHTGYLVGEWGPDRMVEMVRRRWLQKTAPPPANGNLFTLMRKVTHYREGQAG